jgi:hypothetical protein
LIVELRRKAIEERIFKNDLRLNPEYMIGGIHPSPYFSRWGRGDKG